jgi:ketosteroid isomerase-like protein
MRHRVLGSFVTLIMAACGTAPQGTGLASTEVADQFWSQYIEAELAGDADALVGLHAADARIYPADGSVVQGHEEIRGMIATYFPALRATQVQIAVEDAWDAGSTILHTASYREVFAAADGEMMEDSGRFFAALVTDATGSRRIGRLMIQSTAK